MGNQSNLLPGFDDYPSQSNAVFKSCLHALSRPGLISDFEPNLKSPAPLLPTAAAVFLTLADFETKFWLDPALANHPAVIEFLRFHTGAQHVSNHNEADFAVLADSASIPALGEFMQGTPEFPDRSTTLIVQVAELAQNGWTFTGPGINGTLDFSATPLPQGFKSELLQNRSRFPCGIDLIFISTTQLAALPRSVNLQQPEG